MTLRVPTLPEQPTQDLTRRGLRDLLDEELSRQKRSSSSAVTPAPGTTKAATRSPNLSSASPATATSLTPGWRARASSTSTGWMFSPPLMIMSSTRPAT
ncbi:MAG: hypothetical protein AUF63_03790 [Candidatus Rokubacteria bacterium 13_1_20CM_70_15]|nr:MAG: hypothetical protein AUF63_03790 [Candidatus Rokubacteria bacterium 13_1_20CM_70_15]